MVILTDFKIEEFACKCGCGANNMQEEFLATLQNFRKEMAIPFVIDSGFRCKKHNADVGGKPDSMHLVGRAADISTHDMSDLVRHVFLRRALAIFGGVGVAKQFFHVDNRGKHATWTY